MNAIRSTKYLAGSRGAPCTLRIPGVCTGGGEDTVPAHIRDRHTGRRQAKMPDGTLINELDWLFYALRGLQDTLDRRADLGLLKIGH